MIVSRICSSPSLLRWCSAIYILLLYFTLTPYSNTLAEKQTSWNTTLSKENVPFRQVLCMGHARLGMRPT